MTTSTVEETPGRELLLPAWGRFAAAAVAVVVLGCVCVPVATLAHPSPSLHAAALFVHLASLVLGFGAVLAVDWIALLWVLGRRATGDLLAMAANVTVPIWLGYAGLVFSGLLLEPDLRSPLTQVKLGMVLVIGLNGVFAAWQHAALQQNDSPRLFVLGSMSAMVSQAAWWGALVVGHLNTQ